MKNHIKIVSRYDPRHFADRVSRIYAANPDFSVDWSVDPVYLPIPDDLIVCDACNTMIEGKTVNLLVLDGHVWGTVCGDCKAKYHSKLLVVEDYE